MQGSFSETITLADRRPNNLWLTPTQLFSPTTAELDARPRLVGMIYTPLSSFTGDQGPTVAYKVWSKPSPANFAVNNFVGFPGAPAEVIFDIGKEFGTGARLVADSTVYPYYGIQDYPADQLGHSDSDFNSGNGFTLPGSFGQPNITESESTPGICGRLLYRENRDAEITKSWIYNYTTNNRAPPKPQFLGWPSSSQPDSDPAMITLETALENIPQGWTTTQTPAQFFANGNPNAYWTMDEAVPCVINGVDTVAVVMRVNSQANYAYGPKGVWVFIETPDPKGELYVDWATVMKGFDEVISRVLGVFRSVTPGLRRMVLAEQPIAVRAPLTVRDNKPVMTSMSNFTTRINQIFGSKSFTVDVFRDGYNYGKLSVVWIPEKCSHEIFGKIEDYRYAITDASQLIWRNPQYGAVVTDLPTVSGLAFEEKYRETTTRAQNFHQFSLRDIAAAVRQLQLDESYQSEDVEFPESSDDEIETFDDYDHLEDFLDSDHSLRRCATVLGLDEFFQGAGASGIAGGIASGLGNSLGAYQQNQWDNMSREDRQAHDAFMSSMGLNNGLTMNQANWEGTNKNDVLNSNLRIREDAFKRRGYNAGSNAFIGSGPTITEIPTKGNSLALEHRPTALRAQARRGTPNVAPATGLPPIPTHDQNTSINIRPSGDTDA